MLSGCHNRLIKRLKQLCGVGKGERRGNIVELWKGEVKLVWRIAEIQACALEAVVGEVGRDR